MSPLPQCILYSRDERLVDQLLRTAAPVAVIQPIEAQEDLESLGAQALYVPTNVGDRAQVENAVAQTVDRFGTVHILVNNAWAGGRMTRVENAPDEAMERGFAELCLGDSPCANEHGSEQLFHAAPLGVRPDDLPIQELDGHRVLGTAQREDAGDRL